MSDNTDNTPMDKKATAKYLGCSIPQINNLVNRGAIPEGQTIGGRKKHWFKVHLDQYIASQLAKATESWGSYAADKKKPATSVKPAKVHQLKAVPRAGRDEIDSQDQLRRQAEHIQESCQSDVASNEANHLRSIIGDLSELLKSRKSRA